MLADTCAAKDPGSFSCRVPSAGIDSVTTSSGSATIQLPPLPEHHTVTKLSTIMNTPLILRPLTPTEVDAWPVNPPTFGLWEFNKDSTLDLRPVAFLHDDVLFDPEGNFFEA